MVRYFEVVGENLTLKVNIKKGYNPTVEDLEKHFSAKLRELNRSEYNKLTKEFENKKL